MSAIVAALDDALRGEDAERDRQVERRAGLAHVGRRQVDRDAVRRKLEAGVADRAPDAVAALAHAGVRQADHREDRQAERHVDFDVDGAGLDAEDGGGAKAREHAQCRVQGRGAVARACFRTTYARCEPVDVAETARRMLSAAAECAGAVQKDRALDCVSSRAQASWRAVDRSAAAPAQMSAAGERGSRS